jgi:hypothetical protein
MITAKQKSKLMQIKEQRKRQIILFEQLIKPLRDNLKLLNEVLRSQKNIIEFKAHTKFVNRYLLECFKAGL